MKQIDCSGCGKKNIPHGCVKNSGRFFCDIPCLERWFRKVPVSLMTHAEIRTLVARGKEEDQFEEAALDLLGEVAAQLAELNANRRGRGESNEQ